jgi:hypothetical protein
VGEGLHHRSDRTVGLVDVLPAGTRGAIGADLNREEPLARNESSKTNTRPEGRCGLAGGPSFNPGGWTALRDTMLDFSQSIDSGKNFISSDLACK